MDKPVTETFEELQETIKDPHVAAILVLAAEVGSLNDCLGECVQNLCDTIKDVHADRT